MGGSLPGGLIAALRQRAATGFLYMTAERCCHAIHSGSSVSVCRSSKYSHRPCAICFSGAHQKILLFVQTTGQLECKRTHHPLLDLLPCIVLQYTLSTDLCKSPKRLFRHGQRAAGMHRGSEIICKPNHIKASFVIDL